MIIASEIKQICLSKILFFRISLAYRRSPEFITLLWGWSCSQYYIAYNNLAAVTNTLSLDENLSQQFQQFISKPITSIIQAAITYTYLLPRLLHYVLYDQCSRYLLFSPGLCLFIRDHIDVAQYNSALIQKF